MRKQSIRHCSPLPYAAVLPPASHECDRVDEETLYPTKILGKPRGICRSHEPRCSRAKLDAEVVFLAKLLSLLNDIFGNGDHRRMLDEPSIVCANAFEPEHPTQAVVMALGPSAAATVAEPPVDEVGIIVVWYQLGAQSSGGPRNSGLLKRWIWPLMTIPVCRLWVCVDDVAADLCPEFGW